MSTEIACIWIDYIFKAIFYIALGTIAFIQCIRIKKKIKNQYNDWVLIIWWALYVLNFFWRIIVEITSRIKTQNFVTVTVLFFNIQWVCMYGFEIMTIVYPTLLILYCSQLSYLLRDKTFYQVKKKINWNELIILITAFTIQAIYLGIQVVSAIFIRSNNWYRYQDGKFEKVHSLKWVKLYKINTFTNIYSDLLLAVTLLLMQIMLYLNLIKTMRTKLYYFYQSTKRQIKILFVWNILFFWTSILFDLIYIFSSKDNYDIIFGQNKMNLAKVIW